MYTIFLNVYILMFQIAMQIGKINREVVGK